MLNKKSITLLKLLAILVYAALSQGCAKCNSNIIDVQNARNYLELKDIISCLECKKADIFIECHLQKKTFNIFLLESRNQQFRFVIDNDGRILEKYLQETTTRHHVFPRYHLPETFSDFK